MKRKEFFNKLVNELEFLNAEEILKVIQTYENDIKKRIKKGEKEKNIILSFGDPEDIGNDLYKAKKKEKLEKIKKFFNKIKDKIFSFIKKIKLKFKKNKTKKNVRIKKSNKKIKVQTKRNHILRNILLYLLIILFFVNNIILFTTLIMFIDGIKVIGPSITLFSLSIILLLLIINNDDYYNFKNLNKNIKLSVIIIISLIFSFGVSYSIHEFYNLNYENKIEEKYTMTKITNKVKVESNVKKYDIYLNSFYKTNYKIEIDDKLDREIKIQAKYYECLNDFNYKVTKDTLYLSMFENKRDIISFYLENLRENKIYNYKELVRYEITIFMSSKIKEIVKFHN